MQSSSWGQLKSRFGWQVRHIVNGDCGALVLVRQVLPGVKFAYLPKGPVGGTREQFWQGLDDTCRTERCAFLKIEPDAWEQDDPGWQEGMHSSPPRTIRSRHSIQPMRTIVVDISGDESSILGRMKQKTRYNINLATRKGVGVKSDTRQEAFYSLMKATGQRDEFEIHSLAYYQAAFELFRPGEHCQLLVAEAKGQPISALMVFRAGKRAWYFYGASADAHRELMPNYLLQWEAIRWARSQGCTEYDLWGVPDYDLASLERDFTARSAGLWGVYRFKRGFGGELRRSTGPWDRVYNPFIYQLYSFWLKLKKTQE